MPQLLDPPPASDMNRNQDALPSVSQDATAEPDSSQNLVQDPPASYNLRVKDMPKDQRPRERLLAYGAKTLSAAELLPILTMKNRFGT